MGVWLYEDPHITISELAVGGSAAGARELHFQLKVDNRNDFDVAVLRAEVELQVEQALVAHDSAVVNRPIGARDHEYFQFALNPGGRGANALGWIRQAGSRFSVGGHIVVGTPIGKRTVQFSQRGRGPVKSE